MSEVILVVYQLAILIFSIMVHEVSHGYAAYALGDSTAKDAGRLNFNPLRHLDFFGSFLLPLSLYFVSAGAFVFGWAKPVPYNPMNLKNPRSGSGLIALVGPLSNLILAIIAAVLLQLNIAFALGIFPALLHIAILLNLTLMIFNLVPIPPLDGSKILFALLPPRFFEVERFLEQYGLWILVLFIFFGFRLIIPVIFFLFRLLVP